MATYELPINSPLTETGDDVYCKPLDSDFAGGVTWVTGTESAIEVADTNVYEVTLDEEDGYIVYLNGSSNAFTADAGSNEIIDVAHGLSNGEIVRFKGLDLPDGLEQSTQYYVIDAIANPDRFRVSLTAGGAAENLGDAGTVPMVYVAVSQRSKANDVVLGTVPIVKPAVLVGEGEVDGYTTEQAMRLMLSALTGKVVATSTSFVARAADDSKDRITATTTADGDRTVVTLDATP